MRGVVLSLICGGGMAFEALAGVTLISDPKVLTIPVHENKEEWVNLRQQHAIVLGPSPEIPDNQDYFYLRKTVYEKLKQAQSLLPKDLKFCLYEGYRSLDLQKMLFDKQYHHVQQRHPDWVEHDIFLETTKLISPVINLDRTLNIPPHSTGAAIDVYLVDKQGKAVDMGIHPRDWMLDKDAKISLTASIHISKEAQKNREIMSQVLSKVGFVNYPTEYWHWSYGDRYWAFMLGKPHAIYGNSYSPR